MNIIVLSLSCTLEHHLTTLSYHTFWQRHGYGIAKYGDGEVFNGEWKHGMRHGHGALHNWFVNKKHDIGVYYWQDGEVDVSWYQDDVRLESLRWMNDRRHSYRLDLSSSSKEQVSLVRAADVVKGWERKEHSGNEHRQL